MKSLLSLVLLVALSWTSYAQPQSNENENKTCIARLSERQSL